MAGIRVRNTAVALTTAIIAMVTAVVPTSAADAAGPLTITWPTVTAFNPDVTDYVLDIDYGGTGSLFLSNDGRLGTSTWEALPASGTYAVRFPADNIGLRYLRITECPTSQGGPGCVQRGPAHELEVYSRFLPHLPASRLSLGPVTPIPVSFTPSGGAPLDVEWKVTGVGDPNGPILASGTATGVPAGEPLPAIGPQDDPTSALRSGTQYLYTATVHGDVEPYGPLSGSVSRAFTWDAVNKAGLVAFKVKDSLFHQTDKAADVFYPAEDAAHEGWRDQVAIRLLAGEPLPQVHTTITGPTGDVVLDSDDDAFRWTGRDADGQLLPEGTYTVSMDTADRAFNAKTVEGRIRLSHEEIYFHAWHTTVSPKASMIDKYVGRCASLESPARPGWRGSLGLRSRTSGRSCRTSSSQTVSTVHGIYLPRSPFGHFDLYRRLTVSTYGGAARGAKHAYLIHAYWARDEQWYGRKQLGAALGWHDGTRTGWHVVLGDQYADPPENPSVIWSVGLSEGAAYDVKKFRVQVSYWDLRQPS